MDIYFLEKEIDATDMSALEAVICVDEERAKLEKEAEDLANVVRWGSGKLGADWYECCDVTWITWYGDKQESCEQFKMLLR